MDRVGTPFTAKYFLPQLIMAGKIFKQALTLISPHFLTQDISASSLRILIGTVHGDIHETGTE
jgi:methanogenic corrinoid protein MtbC1